jgi:hypothetical protein
MKQTCLDTNLDQGSTSYENAGILHHFPTEMLLLKIYETGFKPI